MANIDIIKELRNDPWPFNVLKYTSKIVKEKLGEDYGMTLEGTQNLINSLKEQEKTVLELRVSDGLTHAKIASILGISSQRVQQIEGLALMRIQNEGRLKRFAYVSQKVVRNVRAESFETRYRLNLCITYGKFPSWMAKYMDGITTSPIIEDLDLSVRSFNCLKRSGYNTLDDILNASEGDLLRIRNLGSRSIKEIVDKIHELGMKMKWETENEIKEG